MLCHPKTSCFWMFLIKNYKFVTQRPHILENDQICLKNKIFFFFFTNFHPNLWKNTILGNFATLTLKTRALHLHLFYMVVYSLPPPPPPRIALCMFSRQGILDKALKRYTATWVASLYWNNMHQTFQEVLEKKNHYESRQGFWVGWQINTITMDTGWQLPWILRDID